MYLGRVAAVNGGLPVETPAFTLNRLCGSGLQAIVSAAQAIKLGDCDVAVAGGAESMSRGQYWLPGMRWGQRMQDGKVVDAMVGALTDPFDDCHMGVTAENVATGFRRVPGRSGRAGRREPPPRGGGNRGRLLQGADHCRSRCTGKKGTVTVRHRRAHPPGRDHGRPGQAEAGLRQGRHGHRRATPPASTTPRPRSCWPTRPTPSSTGTPRSGGWSPTATPGSSRGSWAWARCPRCARCWNGPA